MGVYITDGDREIEILCAHDVAVFVLKMWRKYYLAIPFSICQFMDDLAKLQSVFVLFIYKFQGNIVYGRPVSPKSYELFDRSAGIKKDVGIISNLLGLVGCRRRILLQLLHLLWLLDFMKALEDRCLPLQWS